MKKSLAITTDMTNTKKIKGFILLFTVVVISVTVGLSATMLAASNRQAQLGSLQSETQSAFYAADTGIGCALVRIYSTAVPAPAFTCEGMTPADQNPSSNKDVYFYDFRLAGFTVGGVSPACGVVVITDETANLAKPQYIVESYGYNICDVGITPGVLVPATSNPNLIERKILVKIPVVNIV